MAHRTSSIERVLCRVHLQHVPQVSLQQERYPPYDKKRLCRPAIHHPWQAGVCPFLASVSSNVHPRISRSAKYLSCSPSISVWLRHCALWGALMSLSLDRILFFFPSSVFATAAALPRTPLHPSRSTCLAKRCPHRYCFRVHSSNITIVP